MTPVLGEIIGWELLLVIAVIALLFGAKNLPKLARSPPGRTMRPTPSISRLRFGA